MQKTLPSTNAIRPDAYKRLHCQNIIIKTRLDIESLRLQKTEARELAPAGANLKSLQSRKLMEEDK